MSAANELCRGLTSEAWSRLEQRVKDFEEAWRRGERPPIEAPPDPDGLPLLAELVHAELECRLKGGEAVRVEDYLRRFPTFAEDRSAVLELIVAEYEHRRRGEPGLAEDEYARRFPEYAEALPGRLATSRRKESDGPAAAEHGSESAIPTKVKDPNGTVDFRLPPGAALPSQSETPVTSSAPVVIAGFQVLKILGRGGMGVVYLAQQVSLKRLVALKLLRAEGRADAEILARFQTEAETIAGLQHPNIVQVYESGTHGGLPYFALEYVDGGSLAGKLNGQPWPPRRAAELVQTLAAAVHAAHQRGVIHRDLKPANVMLTADGTPKITDFGLAKQTASDAGLTQTGVVMGTPAYMAPEQARGLSESIGPRSDVFGLGAILYELLTGRPPHSSPDSQGSWVQAQQGTVTPPRRLNPRIPRALERICLRALARAPSARYPTAEELAHDLQRYRQRPRQLAVGLGLAALLLLGAGLFLATSGTARPPESAPAASPVVPVPVATLEVQHYRVRGASTARVGNIGETSFSGRFRDDSVRIIARLNAPAYCYLIAFNPDGQEQLCYPAAATAPPAVAELMTHPPGDDAAFGLSDGVGLQAFVLVAGRQPLPAYADWKAQLGPLPWKPARAEGTWRFDGRQFQLLGTDRGELRKLGLPAAFEALGKRLQDGPGVEVIQALAFPVKPNN